MAIPTTFLSATVVKSLGEEFHGTSSRCLKPHPFVAACGEEDRRNLATIRVLHSGQRCQTEHRRLPACWVPRSQGAKRRESFLKRTLPRNVSIATFVLGSSRRRAAGAGCPELRCPICFVWSRFCELPSLAIPVLESDMRDRSRIAFAEEESSSEQHQEGKEDAKHEMCN